MSATSAAAGPRRRSRPRAGSRVSSPTSRPAAGIRLRRDARNSRPSPRTSGTSGTCRRSGSAADRLAPRRGPGLLEEPQQPGVVDREDRLGAVLGRAWIVKQPSASSVRRIRSARSATSFAGMTAPVTVSVDRVMREVVPGCRRRACGPTSSTGRGRPARSLAAEDRSPSLRRGGGRSRLWPGAATSTTTILRRHPIADPSCRPRPRSCGGPRRSERRRAEAPSNGRYSKHRPDSRPRGHAAAWTARAAGRLSTTAAAGRSLLVRVPRRRVPGAAVGEKRGHRPEDLGGSSSRQELVRVLAGRRRPRRDRRRRARAARNVHRDARRRPPRTIARAVAGDSDWPSFDGVPSPPATATTPAARTSRSSTRVVVRCVSRGRGGAGPWPPTCRCATSRRATAPPRRRRSARPSGRGGASRRTFPPRGQGSLVRPLDEDVGTRSGRPA